MGAEYERKYLPLNDGWYDDVVDSVDIVQGYLAVTDTVSVRVRLAGDIATMAVKSQAVEGIKRVEVETPISISDAEQLIELATGVVRKTRSTLTLSPHAWTVDVFHAENAGLVLIEVEGAGDFQLHQQPDWLGTEVTSDERYLNSYLSATPYTTWPESERALATNGERQ